jgi:hypothetical protein
MGAVSGRTDGYTACWHIRAKVSNILYLRLVESNLRRHRRSKSEASCLQRILLRLTGRAGRAAMATRHSHPVVARTNYCMTDNEMAIQNAVDGVRRQSFAWVALSSRT